MPTAGSFTPFNRSPDTAFRKLHSVICLAFSFRSFHQPFLPGHPSILPWQGAAQQKPRHCSTSQTLPYGIPALGVLAGQTISGIIPQS